MEARAPVIGWLKVESAGIGIVVVVPWWIFRHGAALEIERLRYFGRAIHLQKEAFRSAYMSLAFWIAPSEAL